MRVGERFNPHRMFDGVFIPEAICQYKGISPGAKLAYGRFCRFAGRTDEVFPSMATLGREIGCSANQARSYVKELIDDRFVEVERDPGRVNTYYFLWHSAFDGEIGAVRFSPLQDAGGVEVNARTPPGCWRRKRVIRRESSKRVKYPPTPLYKTLSTPNRKPRSRSRHRDVHTERLPA